VRRLAIRLRDGLRQVRVDLRKPLPGADQMSPRGRFVQRVRFLTARYGWRLLVTLFIYYLVRDVVLYLLLPYLAVSQLFAH